MRTPYLQVVVDHLLGILTVLYCTVPVYRMLTTVSRSSTVQKPTTYSTDYYLQYSYRIYTVYSTQYCTILYRVLYPKAGIGTV